MTKYTGVTAFAAALAFSVPTAARAQEAAPRSYNIPAQDLGQALTAFAAWSGREVVAPGATVAGKRSGAAIGPLTPEQAMTRLLAGTGFAFSQVDGAFVIRPIGAGGSETLAANDYPQIVVTGSRIAGAAVPSPVISIDREEARNAGQATVREIVRSIPQNFGGGQNPGIGFNVPEASGADIGGGASINLRGLGSDATLTLLNGHRLSYNANKQSVDISGIPLGAIDRVDVMPDGASALFGSDAVAGVVNILLRRDLDGLETTTQLGGAADGGYFTQLYAATAGKVWAGGHALLAYQYDSSGKVTSNQRDYAASRPGLDLLPRLRQHSLLASARQDLGADMVIIVDGTYNKRGKDIVFPLNFAGDRSVSRSHTAQRAESFGLSAAFEWSIGRDWSTTLLGTYGEDRVRSDGETFTGTTRSDNGSNAYRNRARSIELAASGPLMALPGGPAKIALGAGYRRIDLLRNNRLNPAQNNFSRAQPDYYAFGELNLPLLRHVDSVVPIDSLTVHAAARYENYRDIDEVTTPKLGLIYAPTVDVSLKTSWGKSFRAPTLYQQYSPRSIFLAPVTLVGGQGFPAGTTALLLLGGSTMLKPERSENWSATLDLHPRGLPGASLELSYFSIHYRNRIVTPIPSFSAALSNPGYADFVVRNPTAAAQASVIASAATFTNISGGVYLPGTVAALVDNSSVNAGRQTISGIDGLARYLLPLAEGRLSASLNATYLDSEQQIAPALPVTQLAGVIFNPPHVRLRGTLGWDAGPLTVTGAVTHVGTVVDNRSEPKVRVRGMTPVDLTIRFKGERGILAGLDIVGSVQNIFNVGPAPIATTLYFDTPYDSTNYSPLGRIFSLSVLKSW